METNFKSGFLAGYQFLQFSEGNISQKNCVPHVIRKFYFRSGLTTVRDWLSSLFSKELGRLKTTPAYIAK